jgi:hypothetical protein
MCTGPGVVCPGRGTESARSVRLPRTNPHRIRGLYPRCPSGPAGPAGRRHQHHTDGHPPELGFPSPCGGIRTAVGCRCRGSWRTIHMSPLRRSPPIAIITAVPAPRQQAESQRSPGGTALQQQPHAFPPGPRPSVFQGSGSSPMRKGWARPVFGLLSGSISTRVDDAVEKSRFRRSERPQMTRLSDLRSTGNRLCRIEPGDNPERFPIR